MTSYVHLRWHQLRVLSLFLLGIICFSDAKAGLPDTILEVKPSVVGVGVYRPAGSPRGELLGTGFVVAKGVVATNAHVLNKPLAVAQQETYAIFLSMKGKSQVVQATLLAEDRLHDLALLRVDGLARPAMQLTNRVFREGESMAFMGFPVGGILGLYHATHAGIISAITPVVIPARNANELTAEQLQLLRQPYMVYQLDATAYPGNSGSPVFNPQTGEVFAVINKVLVKGTRETALTNPTDITYAIPISHLQALMARAAIPSI